ncbi:MAG TPA: hypothetical protein VNN18_06595 [Candidatus Xenobia bacterium]|nr:hypothetical protein [Candidatus Xenobia bacterium]
MTSPKRALFPLAVLLLLVPLPAAGQVTETAPVKIKTPKPKKEKFKGEVLSMTRVAITVRGRDNYNLVRTFTFDEKLAAKMAKQIDENKPYQFGDRVEIHYLAGSEVATKIKGKRGQNRP